MYKSDRETEEHQDNAYSAYNRAPELFVHFFAHRVPPVKAVYPACDSPEYQAEYDISFRVCLGRLIKGLLLGLLLLFAGAHGIVGDFSSTFCAKHNFPPKKTIKILFIAVLFIICCCFVLLYHNAAEHVNNYILFILIFCCYNA